MSFRTLLVGLLAVVPATAQADGIASWIDGELDDLEALYREFHRNPEITFREIETSKRVANELANYGAVVTRNVGGLGVVGIIENGDGPTLMLRGDMDALPIGERTGLDYVSKIRKETPDGRVEGVMHACGHDVHMSVMLGAARFLSEHTDLWSGTLLCIGQPAEERGAGARAMLDDGLFDRFPRPDYAFAIHVSSDMATGTIGTRPGPAMANVDSVDITLFGRGGHGAKPHETIDPIVQAAQLVLDLQTIVSRETNPIEPAVVTVGSIQAGTKHNIIPGRCDLQLTVRSMTDAERTRIRAAIERKAAAVAMAAGAKAPEIRFSEGTPSLSNDPELVARTMTILGASLGTDNVVTVDPAMTGEDFAHFGREGIPSVMLRLGTIAPERLARYRTAGEAPPSLHSAFYYPDARESLRTGIRAFVALALDLCAK